VRRRNNVGKRKKEGKGVEGGASPQASSQKNLQVTQENIQNQNSPSSTSLLSTKVSSSRVSLIDRKVSRKSLPAEVSSSSFLEDLEGSSSKEYGYVIARYLMAKWFGVMPRGGEEKVTVTASSFDTKS
jgi:hypothetical protein